MTVVKANNNCQLWLIIVSAYFILVVNCIQLGKNGNSSVLVNTDGRSTTISVSGASTNSVNEENRASEGVFPDSAVITAEEVAAAQCENATFLAAELLITERVRTDILSSRYIAGLIKLGKYKSAQKEFLTLDDPVSKVHSIVSDVYNEKDPRKRYLSAKKVCHFLSQMSNQSESDLTCGVYLVATSALAHKMESYRKKGKEDEINEEWEVPPEILMVSEEFVAGNCTTTVMSAGVLGIISEKDRLALRGLTIRLLGKLKDDIRNGNTEEIIKYCRVPRSFDSLKRFLPEIVRTAYNGTKTNFEAVEKFAQDLCHSELSAGAILTLQNELKKTQGGHLTEMLQLGVSIRKFGWNEGKKFDGKEETEKLFGQLRRNLPRAMGKMIWGSRCAIKNHQTGKYLHTSGDNNTNTFLVEASIKKWSDERGKWWQFHPWKKEDNANGTGEGLYWLVKTMEWERDKPYLCVRLKTTKEKKKPKAPTPAPTTDPGQVETCYKTGFHNRKMMMANWVLDPVVRNGSVSENLFRIYTFDRKSRRYDLFVEVVPAPKAKEKVDIKEDFEKDDEEEDTDADDEAKERRVSRQLVSYVLLGKPDSSTAVGSYWQIECE